MSDEAKFTIGFIAITLAIMWSAFHFIQYDHTRRHSEYLEKLEQGYYFVPEVKGHWEKVK